MADYHIAQVNVGRIKGPIDGPVMAGFVARLDEINALADRSPGFVCASKRRRETQPIFDLMRTTASS
jgi:hypothetical protein